MEAVYQDKFCSIVEPTEHSNSMRLCQSDCSRQQPMAFTIHFAESKACISPIKLQDGFLRHAAQHMRNSSLPNVNERKMSLYRYGSKWINEWASHVAKPNHESGFNKALPVGEQQGRTPVSTSKIPSPVHQNVTSPTSCKHSQVTFCMLVLLFLFSCKMQFLNCTWYVLYLCFVITLYIL